MECIEALHIPKKEEQERKAQIEHLERSINETKGKIKSVKSF
jgi:hypothetical protein